MDPVTAIGLLSGAFQIAQYVKDTAGALAHLYGKFKDADLTIRSLIGELTTIRSAITQLHEWASYNVRDSSEPDEYVEGLEVALDGCRAVMEVLSDEVSALTRGAMLSDTGIGFRTRVKVVWNEDSMKVHQERLRAQVHALQLLLQACQCRTSTEQVELLRRAENRQIIAKVASDTATLRSAYSYVPSRAETPSLTRRSSSVGDTVFDFDRTVVTSLPYRRAIGQSRTHPTTQAAVNRSTYSPPIDEGYGSGTVSSASPPGTSGVLPIHPSASFDSSHGHSKSVSFAPTPLPQSPTQVRRWQSDASGASWGNRSSGSRREKIRSIIRQLRRPSWSATQASVRVPGRSPSERRLYERDLNTSINLTSPDGASAPPIIKSAQSGSRSDVERLLESGHDIEARHIPSRRTALLVASHCGNEDVLDLLLQRNARMDATDKSGSTALHLAASRGHCRVLELLLPECLDIEARNANGQTALWVAAHYGQAEATNLLLACHAKVNARANDQATPLHLAAKLGDIVIARILIQNGADLEAKDGTMMAPLHYACEGGHLDVMELLLNEKANVNAAGSDRRTPLICAAALGQLLATQLLLKKKASTRSVDDAAMTALHWAAYNGHTEIVDILSQKKGLLARTNIAGRTALHLAAMKSQFAVVELLLRKSMPLENRCLSGLTPLHYACMADNCEVTKLLLISGANIEAQADSDQRRPVHLAAVRGSMALLNLLCDKGASLDARDTAGDRALCVASRYGHAAAVQNLLDRGSPVCLPYGVRSEEDSPLCLAAMGGHVPVVTLLLQRGASAIKRDERGWQPYRYAAYYGHPSALRLLMSCSPLVAKDDADLGLTAERIGFAPSADISIERKREVQSLLYQMQHPSQPGAEGSPAWSFPLKPNQQHPVPSGVLSDVAVYHTQLSPTAETSPQELPGTLEQGLPASRSQTPEHMRRGSSIYQRIDSEFRDVPQILEANERAFAPTNEQIAMPQARHYYQVPGGTPSPSSPFLESVFSHAGERVGVRATDSPVSLTDVHGLNPPRASWTAPLSHAGGEGQKKEREWDTESSISSVYTAPEEEVAELAA
ncbi:hypothetical protein AnigIFM50267_008206 [Aspergillus niger]|nr:hypothetical protein AnigIFM50267_008206 [Aspergillus niger]